jgi:hypothetical protein
VDDTQGSVGNKGAKLDIGRSIIEGIGMLKLDEIHDALCVASRSKEEVV